MTRRTDDQKKKDAAAALAEPPAGQSDDDAPISTGQVEFADRIARILAEPPPEGVTQLDDGERIHASLEGMTVDVETVTTHPSNPRRGNLEAIAESLAANGQYKPVVVQKSTGFIVAGNHTRRAAAELLGWKRIAAVVHDLTDEQARRILLADNRTSDLGEYDETLLVRELRQLENLIGTGYDQPALDGLVEQLADLQTREAPAAPAEFNAITPDGLQTDYQCPRCRYEWSGKAKGAETPPGEG